MGECNKLYNIGELAKMTNSSKKAIRYYQEEGLLSPYSVADNGYYEYSEGEKKKVERINALKYFGIPIKEIKEIVYEDNVKKLNEILIEQEKKIETNIRDLQSVYMMIDSIIQSISNDTSTSWNDFIRAYKIMNMNKDAMSIYNTTKNLEDRIRLHNGTSGTMEPWFRWICRNIYFSSTKTVLDIGCGNGELWIQNINKVLPETKIMLSDISTTMIMEARRRLQRFPQFEFQVADICELPFEDNSYDLVIASHVLFYANEVSKAISEIKRVLSPNGIFCCTTYGKKHMKEIEELVKKYDSRIYLSSIDLYEIFGKENAKSVLSGFFKDVKSFSYQDDIEISDSELLMGYINGCHGNQRDYLEGKQKGFYSYIKKACEKDGGFRYTKDAVMFLCRE